MSTAGIILLVAVGAVCVFELISLVLTIIKKKKLKQQPEIEVNNVKQEDSEDSSLDLTKEN